MMKKSTKKSTKTKGKITSFSVSGSDRNSGQLEIVVNGTNVVVNSQPTSTDAGHEPQVFAAYASLSSMALTSKLDVEVAYVVRNRTNWVTSMRLVT